jgi:serine/threonine-protein kinase
VGPSAKEVRDAHDRYANIEARADAALAGVEQIRSQQRAQGLDLRGDIVAAMNRLHHQLDEAHQALAQKDLDTANQYMERADSETTVLEKFLGR